MPVVHVRMNIESKMDLGRYHEITQMLPALVAKHLHAPPDGNLTPEEVTVWDLTEGYPRGVHSKDVEIVIFAHHFPERVADIEQRTQQIINQLAEWMPAGTTFSVLVSLGLLTWGEAVGKE
jgi:hypothetical protein